MPGTSEQSDGDAHRFDLRILTAVRRIIRAVDIHSRRLATEHKVTGPQLICLLAVRDAGPLTAADLARQVHLSPSTIVGILDRLEEKKLIFRTRSSRDRRRIHISLTPNGLELAGRAPSPLQDRLAEGLGRLPEPEQAAIAASLEKLVDLMEARDLSAAPFLDTGPLQAEGGGEEAS